MIPNQTGPNQTGHTERNMPRDIGEYSDDKGKSYKNSWVLLSSNSNFRYFGKSARKIPDACPGLLEVAKKLGQGHRVYKDADPKSQELKHLVDDLFQRETPYTQSTVPIKRARSSFETPEESTGNTGVLKRAKKRC